MNLRAIVLAAALQSACVAAGAQDASTSSSTLTCPQASEVARRHLLGLWRAEFEGGAGATLLLETHPQFAESMRGAINRNGEKAQVAGDVEDGEFTLEESVNGVNISATWTGTVEANSCGTRIVGTWQSAHGAHSRAFVLRKQPESR